MFQIKEAAVISIACLSFITLANAEEPNTCETTDIEHVSLYFSKTIGLDGDPGSLYKKAVDEVNAVATKNDFKNYKMTSDGVSVSTSGYTEMLDISVSITIEYSSDFSAITALSKDTTATSISSQRYFQPCE